MAPEIVEGKQATTRSDVYSLGVLLYQMVIGDLGKALSPGWEARVEDEVVLGDIRACVEGAPDERLSAGSLHTRLRALKERQVEFLLSKRRRTRRRWLGAAATFIALLGLLSTGLVLRERSLRRISDRALYLSSIQLADLKTREGDRRRALDALEVVTKKERGWEWSYLRWANESPQPQIVEPGPDDDFVSVWLDNEAVKVGEVEGSGLAVFSPDGSKLYNLSGSAVSAWDVDTRKRLWQTDVGRDLIVAEVDRKGELLLVSTWSGYVWILEATTGAIRFDLGKFLPSPAMGVSFSPNNRFVMLAEWGRLHVVALDTGGLVRSFDNLYPGVPVGSAWWIEGSDERVEWIDGTTLRRLDLSTDELRDTLLDVPPEVPGTLLGPEVIVLSSAEQTTFSVFSRSRRRVVTGPIEEPRQHGTAHNYWQTCVPTGCAGIRGLTGGDLAMRATLPNEDLGRPRVFQFDIPMAGGRLGPRGRYLAAVPLGSDQTWLVRPSKRVSKGQLLGHRAPIVRLEFLDERRMVSASFDGQIRVWDLDKGSVISEVDVYSDRESRGRLFMVDLAPQGDFLFAKGSGTAAWLFAVDDQGALTPRGELVDWNRQETYKSHWAAMHFPGDRFDPKGRLQVAVTLGEDGLTPSRGGLLDPSSLIEASLLGGAMDSIEDLELLPEFPCRAGHIRWSEQSGDGTSATMVCGQSGPGGILVFTGGPNAEGKVIQLERGGDVGMETAPAISKDGRRVAVLASGTVKVFDSESGATIAEVERRGAFSRPEFNPAGTHLLVGSDNLQQLRNIETGRVERPEPPYDPRQRAAWLIPKFGHDVARVWPQAVGKPKSVQAQAGRALHLSVTLCVGNRVNATGKRN